MNTLENLINNGIDVKTAQDMLDNYSSKIGTMNGVYEIIDITYDFKERGRDVTLKCAKCGRVIHRMMVRSRNKWGELIKSCPCEKEEKRKAESEKIEKNKKAHIEELKSRIGMTFGDYEIVSLENTDDKPKYTLRCKACGAEKIVSANNFSQVKRFDCRKHYMKYSPSLKYDESYIGRKKNFLTVIGITRLPNRKRAFICECDCGNTTTIEPTMWEKEIVKSCGCFRESMLLEHTEELDRLRRIYSGMIQRCYNRNNSTYEHYGGRGITVCKEWLLERDKFIEWALNNGYSNDLSIDRINVNENYEPDNCRWVNWETQANNRRPPKRCNSRKPRKKKTWTINGMTKSRANWCEEYEIPLETVKYRVNHKGMALEEALKTPKMADGRPRKR